MALTGDMCCIGRREQGEEGNANVRGNGEEEEQSTGVEGTDR